MQRSMKRLFVFFLVLVIAKIFLSLAFQSPWVFGDAAIYTAKTRAILTEGNFNFDEYHYGGPAIPPLYSVALIPAYFFDDPEANYRAILIINALLSSLIIFPIFLLARRVITEGPSLFLAVLAGAWPAGFGFTFMIMSENLFFPLFALSALLIYKSFKSDKVLWDVLLGLCLGALYLTRAIGIFPIAAWFLLRFAYVFLSRKPLSYIAKTLITILCAALPIGAWLIVKDSGGSVASASGYDMDSYFAGMKEILSSFGSFKTALGLALNQFSYYSVASFFIFIPLMLGGIFFMPREYKQKWNELKTVTLYTIFCSILFTGASVLHQYIFSEKVPERYLLFGRYIESTVPLFILLGGTVFFLYNKKFAMTVRAKFFSLFVICTAVAILFLPGTMYDIVNNLSLLYVRGVDVIKNFPVAWVWLFFAYFWLFFTPSEWVKKAVMAVILIFSVWSFTPAYSLGVKPSVDYGEKHIITDWIYSNVPKGEVIGFDANRAWEENLMQYFWLYEFWFGKNYHLQFSKLEDFKGRYFISGNNLSNKKILSEAKTYLELYDLSPNGGSQSN